MRFLALHSDVKIGDGRVIFQPYLYVPWHLLLLRSLGTPQIHTFIPLQLFTPGTVTMKWSTQWVFIRLL